MTQYVYLLVDPELKYVADTIQKTAFINQTFESPDAELTEEILSDMAKNCLTEYFFVISSVKEISFPKFDFSFIPPEWDKDYVHIWNNDKTVRLFNKQNVIKNPPRYIDDAYYAGRVKLKNTFIKLYEPYIPQWDIVFLSYDEEHADERFTSLQSKFPRAKRIHGIKGIYEAHKAAAKLVTSSMFFVVDADAEIMPGFNFDYCPTAYARNTVHVWHSKNPVNDLEYGYGGVKLFPTELLLGYNGSPLDFTTSVSTHLKVMRSVSNITQFNTDPFSSWRSAFRECSKLACKDDSESIERLDTWCTIGSDREFGDFVIAGANEGRQYGISHKNQPELLGLINNFAWLEERFSS